MEKFIHEPRYVPVDHDPFAGPVIERIIPTTESQREVLAASEMGPDASCAYNESVTLVLSGALDRQAMERAVKKLVARHEALRSTISPSDTRMIVSTSDVSHLGFIDLSSLSTSDRDKELSSLAKQSMTTPFDLRNGPLFFARLIKTAPSEHLLQFAGHHVVCDGWSLGIMMAEVSTLYNAECAGTASDLPDAVPFSEYALAVAANSKSPDHAVIEKFWLDLFKGAVPRLDLPTDNPRPVVKTYSGNRIDVDLSPELVKGLKEVSTRCGASFVTTLLTIFELLLHKLTDDSDIVVGLPAAGQSDLGMKHLVGHCVNLLALRSRIEEDRSFIDHLKDRRKAVLDAFDNQKYTFGTLLHKLNVKREPGRIPLVPVVFNIDMNLDDGVAFEGLKHRLISDPRAFENFELFLNATGDERKLTLEWSYNTDLFNESTVRGWMEDFSNLISRTIVAPTASIAELIGDGPLAGEQDMPPAEWLGRSTEFPNESVISVFEEVAQIHSDRVALELLDRSITYAELNRRVVALSNDLCALGISSGDPVGLCMDRSFDMITGMLAILRCGGCFVPFDPAYPAERLRFMFDDTKVKVIITQRHLTGLLPEHQAKVVYVDEVTSRTEVLTMPEVSANAPAYIMYTSGSTGVPKGVMIPHRAILRLVRGQDYLPFGPDLTFLQLSNISFDASTLEIWGALLNGGRLVLQPQQKPTLLEITETIARHKVTSVWFTVGLFNLLVDEHLDRLRGLRHILTGGDVLSVPHIRKALKVLGPGVLINGYGPTENTTFTCCFPIDDPSVLKGSIPIGKPIQNTTAHVLDASLKPVAIGRKGELYTGGAGVGLCYWHRDDLTAERFIKDPFSTAPDALLYRTGDIVRWLPDGNIEFIGRADGQVKIRGFRIELGEIENALDEFQAVKDRVVAVRSDLPGEKQLVCYLVPNDRGVVQNAEQQSALIDMIRQQLRKRLPDHMIPSAFVVLDALPLNPNGKVDKKALPAPELRTRKLRADFVAPRDDREKRLAGIWCEVLKADRIGVHENFFDLGGHSLIGIQLLARIEEEFGSTLALRDLFVAATIAEMSELLARQVQATELTNLSAIQPEGNKPPFFCVHGDEANFYLPRLLGNDQPFYGFFHQGEDGRPILYRTVTDIAAHFIAEMRTVKPHGPYLLGGYSFGGIVAYEMAKQLAAARESVPLLVMFDTYAPTEYRKVMRIEQKAYDPLKKWIMRGLVQWYQRNGRILPPKLRHFYIIDTYDKAIMAYDAGTYNGPITVFKASSSLGPDHLGWERKRPSVLDVRVVQGDHYNIIKEPQVNALADELHTAIDRALQHAAMEAV